MNFDEIKENYNKTMVEVKDYLIKNKKMIIITLSCIFALIVILIGTFITIDIIKKNKAKEFNLQSLKPKIEEIGYKDSILIELTTKAEVANTIGVIEKDIDKYIFKTQGQRNKAAMYAIIKPSKNKMNVVKEKLDEYLKVYDELWKNYLPEQYKLIQDKSYGIKNGYIYLFITDKPLEVEKMVKQELR